MANEGWTNEACDLEEQGRFEEARQLAERNGVTREFLSDLAKQIKALADTNPIWKRIRAGKENPNAEKSEIWAEFESLTFKQMLLFWRHLPDPLKNPGRPRGSAVADETIFEEVDRRLAKQTRPVKTIIREILKERGEPPHTELESRVNYLARLYGRRAKK